MFKGHLVSTKESVTIKVPRVPDYIRKEKKEVKIHMEEAKNYFAELKDSNSRSREKLFWRPIIVETL